MIDILPRYYRQLSASPQTRFPLFPGLDIRKVDMSSHNASAPPLSYRTIALYRPFGPLPTSLPNLHACAHLYASDKNSLFLVSNALGFGDHVGTMGSLSHSVVFHVRSEELLLKGEDEEGWKGEWWVQEAWTSRSGQGRGMHESRIWSPSGVHVASTWQEGLVRKAEKAEDEKQRLLWEEGLKRMARLDGKEKL